MDRRDIIRTLGLFMGGISTRTLGLNAVPPEQKVEKKSIMSIKSGFFCSQWGLLPDMIWTGEEFWAQRLQDWCIKEGELQCVQAGPNRTIHLLTHQLAELSAPLMITTQVKFLTTTDPEAKFAHAGWRLGMKGRYPDYRSAIMTGTGIDIGIQLDGRLFIGSVRGDKLIATDKLKKGINLVLKIVPHKDKCHASLKAMDPAGNTLATVKSEQFNEDDWKGNIALLSHFDVKKEDGAPVVSFGSLEVENDGIRYNADQVYGPVYFCQYTTANKTLKLTAQLAPVDLPGSSATLFIKKGEEWKKIDESYIHVNARIARFKINNWEHNEDIPYQVRYKLPLANGESRLYKYEGTIAAEPLNKEKVTAVALSCNWDYGFPDNEVVANALKHRADIAFFLGDQFYENNGDFGIQTAPVEKAELDYLRKWIQFGWSYRELFRHIPMVALPDDHDMYHGNVWGSSGRATIHEGTKADMQDSGGYLMPAEWVNMAQLTQTGHMPDPYDPTPVKQGIGVYYTDWEYAGISFGIIEDRKFKLAPKNVLPKEADVWNGYAQNPDFKHEEEEYDSAVLLGDRQMKFLGQWSNDWKKETAFKVLVSATPFCCLQTLPEGTPNDSITPDLKVPAKGEYIYGDVPTRDMDSNGWPHNRRDAALKMLRKIFTLHLTGDQHLPSVVQYGTDVYGDSGFAFTVPALCNIWPRRWWPPVEAGHVPLEGKPAYTGNFQDGFNNKITVHAAVSPYKTGKEPSMLHNRVSGYGVLIFDKEKRNIELNCWPRDADPSKEHLQYHGWPITISQRDNYQREPKGYLPDIEMDNHGIWHVEVINEHSGELLYHMNIKAKTFKAWVFDDHPHILKIKNPDNGKEKIYRQLKIRK